MPRRPIKATHIAEALALRIAAGEFAPRSWLPTLRELGNQYDADPRTIAAALDELAGRGVVQIVTGRGARVLIPPVRRDAAEITRQVGQWRGFHTAASHAGLEPFTDTFRIADVAAPADVAGRLGIPVGAGVLERARLQGVVVEDSRQPVQLSTTWIVGDVVQRLPVLREHDTGPGGMGSRLAEAGYDLSYEDVVSARLPVEDEARRLGIDSTEPVLVAWRRAFDGGRALEVTVRIINPARHELVFRYS